MWSRRRLRKGSRNRRPAGWQAAAAALGSSLTPSVGSPRAGHGILERGRQSGGPLHAADQQELKKRMAPLLDVMAQGQVEKPSLAHLLRPGYRQLRSVVFSFQKQMKLGADVQDVGFIEEIELAGQALRDGMGRVRHLNAHDGRFGMPDELSAQ